MDFAPTSDGAARASRSSTHKPIRVRTLVDDCLILSDDHRLDASGEVVDGDTGNNHDLDWGYESPWV